MWSISFQKKSLENGAEFFFFLHEVIHFRLWICVVIKGRWNDGGSVMHLKSDSKQKNGLDRSCFYKCDCIVNYIRNTILHPINFSDFLILFVNRNYIQSYSKRKGKKINSLKQLFLLPLHSSISSIEQFVLTFS